jgi:hypothetical protein
MQGGGPDGPNPHSGVGILWRAMFAQEADLSDTEAASTLFRFFRSKHIADLRLFFNVAMATFVFHVLVVVIGAFVYKDTFVSGIRALVTYTAPAVPIYGAVIAWSYLTAASRLGIVDLFACEITTLCRVATIFDVGKRYVDQYNNPQSTHSDFVSQEDYFPVFSSNSSDLKLLEATVVTRITEFYTYMKAARDSQRKLASVNGNADIWRGTIASLIYVTFLGFESARNAINDLIEFEPTQSENGAVILLTELKCYSFLVDYYKNDHMRHARLMLRRNDYKRIVPGLITKIKATHPKNPKCWEGAKEMTSELDQRYREAMAASNRSV